MTETTLNSSQSFGTSTNVGKDKFPVKTVPQSTSSAYFIHGRIVNGAGAYLPNPVRVWFASSPYDVTAAAAPELLRQQARYLDIFPGPNASGDKANCSELEVLAGDVIYTWLELPITTVAAAITVTLVEV